MGKDLRNLELQHQIQRKHAERAANELELAQLEQQQQMYSGAPATAQTTKRDLGLLVIALVVLILGLLAQNEHFLGWR